jgi:hypothetical protein
MTKFLYSPLFGFIVGAVLVAGVIELIESLLIFEFITRVMR